MSTHPKILGITLDTKLAYNTLLQNTLTNAHKSLHINSIKCNDMWQVERDPLSYLYNVVIRLVSSTPLPHGLLQHSDTNSKTTSHAKLCVKDCYRMHHRADTNIQHLHKHIHSHNTSNYMHHKSYKKHNTHAIYFIS